MYKSAQKNHVWQPPNREGWRQFTNIFVFDIALYSALDPSAQLENMSVLVN